MVIVDNRWRSRAKQLKYLREQPRPECSPFDANGTITYGFRTLEERICNGRSPCCSLVKLYAKMGLHRYNLIEGKNYKLDFVEKYHFRWSLVPSPYYITFVASDPSAPLPQTFQTSIDEHQPAGFYLTCNNARIRGETNKYDGGSCYLPGTMPEWPTENPFENGKLFYVLNHSERQDNAWIRLYLELAVAKFGSTTTDPDLSNLKIVNVAMDTQDLNAKNGTVYISYKDSCQARVGKDVDRIAMVRRTFGERTGCFSLMGKHQSSQLIPKKGVNQSEVGVGKDVTSSFDEHTGCLSPMDNLILEKQCKDRQSEDDSCEAGVNERTRCLSPMGKNLTSDKKCKYQRVIRGLGVLKPWRFLSPRRHKKAYKNHGFGLACRLHKTRSIGKSNNVKHFLGVSK